MSRSPLLRNRPPHIRSIDEYKAAHMSALKDPASFWRNNALSLFWQSVPSLERVLSYNFDIRTGPIFVRWFEDGITNICYNCLDVHVENGSANNVAFHWEGNDPNDNFSITYGELLTQVKRFGKAMMDNGVCPGDSVALYMPMVVDIIVAVLACARLGVIHSVVFAGFSASSLAERMIDARCKFLLTADGSWRGPKLLKLKSIASEAMNICSQRGWTVSKCVVLRHITSPPSSNSSLLDGERRNGVRPVHDLVVPMTPGRDVWWDEFLANVPANVDCPVHWSKAEDVLFILYTSGSTGKPKGVVHTTGGYMVYVAKTFYHTFNYQPDDVYWCTADAGWITGHSYVIYGPLLNGATSVIFEGTPLWPDAGRYWATIEKYGVTKFYTAPTAIRALMGYGEEIVGKYRLSSLKVLGSVGEPINPAAWEWYHKVIGGGRCPIVDTFWQTETGGHMITAIPGVNKLKPGSATQPFVGVDARILDDSGQDVVLHGPSGPREGSLVFAKPWPGMMRTILNDHQRFESVYFSRFPGFYLAGDGAKVDDDGDFWITGRIDDMLNVSGHLLSTAEIESAIMLHPSVNEAAAVSRKHPVKGECLHSYITLKDNPSSKVTGLTPELRKEVIDLIRSKVGGFAVPDHIQSISSLPKTRSGKVVRRLLRKAANGDFDFGDTTTLVDPGVLDQLVVIARSNGQSA